MKTWLTLFGMALAVGASLVGGLSYVFATKAEVQALELKQADKTSTSLLEYRIGKLEIRSENIDIRQKRMDKNLDRLLDKFQVLAVPKPNYRLLPERPYQ